MRKTTVNLPDDLKSELERASAELSRSQSDIIREGIRLAIAARTGPPVAVAAGPPPTPTIPIFVSDDPRFAEKLS